MNKTRTLLFSGLATVMVMITLIETGLIKPGFRPLIAQEEDAGIVLEKDGERVWIPAEEWIVVVSAYDPSASVGGVLLGVTHDAIQIQERGESWERELPINEIGVIYHGEAKSIKDYVFGGMKRGGLVSAGIGIISALMFMTQDGLNPGEGLLCGAMMGVFSGIYTLPAGALIGYMRGKAAEGRAVEYVIGPEEWTIGLQ